MAGKAEVMRIGSLKELLPQPSKPSTSKLPQLVISHRFAEPLAVVDHFAAIKQEAIQCGNPTPILVDCGTATGAVLKCFATCLDGAVFSGSPQLFKRLKQRAERAGKILLAGDLSR